ncbi:branched-chain amino acid ABC transporter permease [Streptosporangium pseudovulgare]|uniref:Branched-chain amino acid ABC transporter permease n=1 Tax=Streptosporangium pseudovulgare TaxID=35765 RepID=A0ABQ2RIJ7_9ACTN|nr:branched-chain amino acid ABC transporter permease [Streptosporangium pseudovulgare]
MSDRPTEDRPTGDGRAEGGRAGALPRGLTGNGLARILTRSAAVAVAVAVPFYLEGFWLQAGLFAMSAAVGAIGLNLLTGATGQLSMGHAFFLAVGAYCYVHLSAEPEGGLGGLGLPTPLAAVLAVLAAGVAGGVFSPIAGRLKGAYLGIATLALIFLGQHVLFNATPVTGGYNGRPVPPMELFGFVFADSPALVVARVPFGALERLWFLGLAVLVCAAVFARGVLAGRPGRAMNTIRDHEIAAGVMGVPVARYRAGVFVLSSMYGGLAGVLLALAFQRTVPEYFGLLLSLDYLAMIVIGGLGSVAGAVAGAVFVSMLPQLLTRYGDALPLVAQPGSGGVSPAEAARILYGAAVVAVVLFLPGGLLGLAGRLRPRPARSTSSVRRTSPADPARPADPAGPDRRAVPAAETGRAGKPGKPEKSDRTSFKTSLNPSPDD